MANRFWGDPVMVDYQAPSLQETAWGPMQLKGQEDALRAQVDAMDEAKNTLSSVLGDKAQKTEQFNKEYQTISEQIAQRGATPELIEKAKNLKRLYISDVLPMQEFAKEREKWAAEYSKARMNGDNIIFGGNPLEKSFEEWRKNPNALADFKTIGRDKLTTLGMAYGKNYAEGNVEKDMSDARLGIIGYVKGFKDSNSAWNAYQKDPKFKSLINAQVEEIAKGRGLDPSHPEVRDAITSGIMSGVVGGIERNNLSAHAMKSMFGDGEPTGQNGPALVDFGTSATAPIYTAGDILKVPYLKQTADEASMKAFGLSFDELNKRAGAQGNSSPISQSEMENYGEMAGMDAPRSSGVSDTARKYAIMRDKILQMLPTMGALSKDQMVLENYTAIPYTQPEFRTSAEKAHEGVSKGLERILPTAIGKSLENGDRYGAATKEQEALIKKYIDSGDNKKIEYIGTNVNDISGRPIVKVNLTFKDGKTQVSKDVDLHIPYGDLESTVLRHLRVISSPNSNVVDPKTGKLKYQGTNERFSELESKIRNWSQNIEKP